MELGVPPTFYPLVFMDEQEHMLSLPLVEHTLSAEEFLSSVQEENARSSPFLSVSDYARAYRTRKVTPLDVANKVLASIKKLDEGDLPLRAFINVNREDVLRQARISTELIASNTPRSILEGVPVAIKDEFDQAGYPTTGGTSFINVIVQRDATLVQRLRAMGAVLVGKSNMHEYGFSTIGFNSHHNTPRNPYDLNTHTGGSSSGSAAAAAAGICPITIGGDGGGSVRVPAGLCGLVGLKPTFGRVSEHGAFTICYTVAHAGPLAPTVKDVAIAYAIIAGPDPHDANTLKQPPVILPSLEKKGNLNGLRVGVYRPWFNDAAPSMVSVCNDTVKKMVDLGAQIVELDDSFGELLEPCRLAHTITIASEMATSIHKHHVSPYRHMLGMDVRLNVSIIQCGSQMDYIQSNRVRTLMIDCLKSLFNKIDVIVTPNTGVPAPLIQSTKEVMRMELVSSLMRFVSLANLTGNPAITVPVGYDAGGLPLAMQVIGRWWEEHVLLAVAHVIEEQIAPARRQPAVFCKILE